jgi:hypothetical protein
MTIAVLAFKARFIAPILEGAKRQTLRKATKIEPGMVIQARCRWSEPPFATLRVLDVERVPRQQLVEADALADGFTSLDAMLRFLDDTYGQIEQFVRITFQLEEVDSERAQTFLGDHPAQQDDPRHPAE